ncbi:MAG TPA: hypothetical protein VKM54_20245 [Myxococcota bacterium]|nr:hypothetical protein [Myxococcota bacterium]
MRDLGRCFATRLCAEPDLEDKREHAVPAATEDDIAAFLRAAPPMRGAEYLDAGALRAWWDATAHAFVDEIRAFSGSVQDYLRVHGAAWNVVGRVCFHLAENRADPDLPFAFIATYATRVTSGGKVAHAPLSRALARSHTRGKTGCAQAAEAGENAACLTDRRQCRGVLRLWRHGFTSLQVQTPREIAHLTVICGTGSPNTSRTLSRAFPAELGSKRS